MRRKRNLFRVSRVRPEVPLVVVECAASAAALLCEYLCRRLLRRLSHYAFLYGSMKPDVSARAGIISASDSVIAAVSTITGVGSRRR
jgi:hypothetical protein